MDDTLAQGTPGTQDGILCAGVNHLLLDVIHVERLRFNRLHRHQFFEGETDRQH